MPLVGGWIFVLSPGGLSPELLRPECSEKKKKYNRFGRDFQDFFFVVARGGRKP
jgi:hypothetical protein